MRDLRIQFWDRKERTGDLSIRKQQLDGLVIDSSFDFLTYEQKDNFGKRHMLVSQISQVLISTCRNRNWPVIECERVCSSLQFGDKSFSGLSKRIWTAPSRKWRARIAFEFDITGVHLTAVFYETTKKEIGRVPLGTAVPRIGCLSQLLDGGKWVGPRFSCDAGLRVGGGKFTASVSDVSESPKRW